MLDFESFTYLDVQKTGSTFLCYFLRKFCCETEVHFGKHERVNGRYDPNKFYFVSVREPLEQYISLYSHGCSGNGGLFKKLRRLDRDDLYTSTWSGFRKWLKFVLNPQRASLLDREYGSEDANIHHLIGFQTYRFLELAMLDPVQTLADCRTKEDVRNAYKSKNIVNFVIRNETFSRNLEELLTTKLRTSISDLGAALKFLREGHRLNASDRIDQFEEDPSLPERHRQLLQEREWFLHELFGY